MSKRSASEAERYGDHTSPDPFAPPRLSNINTDFVNALLALRDTRFALRDALDDALVILRRAHRSGDYRGSGLEADTDKLEDDESEPRSPCTFREFARDIAIKKAFRVVRDSELTEAEVAQYLDDLRGRRSVLLPAMNFELHAATYPSGGRTIHIESIRAVCEVHPLITVGVDAYDAWKGRPPIFVPESEIAPRIVDDTAATSSPGIGTAGAEVTDGVAA